MRISDWSSDVCSSDLVVETPVTRQPWWVQVAENALNSPAVGWVITIFSSSRIRPPPTSMSLVLASTVPASGAAGWSLDPPLQAARSGTPTPTTAAPPRARRRLRQVLGSTAISLLAGAAPKPSEPVETSTATSGEPDLVAGDPELPRLQRGGGRSTLDAAVGQGELALVAATIDGRAHGADDAALMGAHRSEALELARRRLEIGSASCRERVCQCV